MITVIISDTHLTTRFNQRKFDYLQKVFSRCDKLIVAGDFWDGHLSDRDKFFDSEWKRLFPLMKSKSCVYIPGNHDELTMADKSQLGLFSTEIVEFYRFSAGSHKFHVEHGDKLLPVPSQKYDLLANSETYKFVASGLLQILEIPFLRIWGNTWIMRGQNKKAKQKFFAKNATDQILVMGHTHCHEFDLENNYINTGTNMFGHGSYLVIDGDQVELRQERW